MKTATKSQTAGVPLSTDLDDPEAFPYFLWDDPSEKSRVDRAVKSLFERVVKLGGTLSGEHGIGVMKAPYLQMEQSAELIALQEKIKAVFDPKHILNPGKIFPADAKRFHGNC